MNCLQFLIYNILIIYVQKLFIEIVVLSYREKAYL